MPEGSGNVKRRSQKKSCMSAFAGFAILQPMRDSRALRVDNAY